jgi:hypothetical protein
MSRTVSKKETNLHLPFICFSFQLDQGSKHIVLPVASTKYSKRCKNACAEIPVRAEWAFLPPSFPCLCARIAPEISRHRAYLRQPPNTVPAPRMFHLPGEPVQPCRQSDPGCVVGGRWQSRKRLCQRIMLVAGARGHRLVHIQAREAVYASTQENEGCQPDVIPGWPRPLDEPVRPRS